MLNRIIDCGKDAVLRVASDVGSGVDVIVMVPAFSTGSHYVPSQSASIFIASVETLDEIAATFKEAADLVRERRTRMDQVYTDADLAF